MLRRLIFGAIILIVLFCAYTIAYAGMPAFKAGLVPFAIGVPANMYHSVVGTYNSSFYPPAQ